MVSTPRIPITIHINSHVNFLESFLPYTYNYITPSEILYQTPWTTPHHIQDTIYTIPIVHIYKWARKKPYMPITVAVFLYMAWSVVYIYSTVPQSLHQYHSHKHCRRRKKNIVMRKERSRGRWGSRGFIGSWGGDEVTCYWFKTHHSYAIW